MTIQKDSAKDSVLIGQLELYNRLWKEQDDIWQKAARKSVFHALLFKFFIYDCRNFTGLPYFESRQIFVKNGIFHVRP